MLRAIQFVLAFAVLFGCVAVAQATMIDFEQPTYTLGALNGQDGWATAATSTVIAAPACFGVPAGAQSAWFAGASNNFSSRSLAGTDFTDTTQFSMLYQGMLNSGSYVQFSLDASNGTAVVPFVKFGMQDSSSTVVYSGIESFLVSRSVNHPYSINGTIDFTAQTYSLTFFDLGDSTTNTFSALPFYNAVTKAQANASGQVVYDTGYKGASAYSDNFSIVPEPSTLALLGCGLIGLLCYAWRKRK